MKNNEHGETNNPTCCYFHPQEVVVGICALCLKERLLFLASEQGHQYQLPPVDECKRPFKVLKGKSIFALLPRVFASSSNFVHHHGNTDHLEDQISIDEDFISIKIGEGGKATKNSKKSVVEPLGVASTTITKEAAELRMLTVERSGNSRVVRWRKRVGRLLLHVGLWKEPGKVSSCHVEFGGEAEEAKGRRGGWIRTLTRRRRRTTNGD